MTKPREKSFPYEDTEPEAHAALASKLYTLTWGGEGEDVQARPLGYMLERVVDELVAAPPEIRGPVHVDRERRTVRAFEDGAGAATGPVIVVNATGLLACRLGGVADPKVVPARGQIVVVRNASPAMYCVSSTEVAEEIVYGTNKVTSGASSVRLNPLFRFSLRAELD